MITFIGDHVFWNSSAKRALIYKKIIFKNTMQPRSWYKIRDLAYKMFD